MKIAIVAGHFMPSIGYQEVYLARAYSRLGHTVQVITSCLASPSAQNIKMDRFVPGEFPSFDNDYTILRLPSLFAFRSNVLPIGLNRAIDVFRPDIIMVVGVGKLFPYRVFNKSFHNKYSIVTLLGNNTDMSTWGKVTWKTIIVQKWLKGWIYALAVKWSSRIVLYTPSTLEIIEYLIPKQQYRKLHQKMKISSLGFDPKVFYFDNSTRDDMRKSLGISSDDLVFITVTRLTPRKQIEVFIDAVVAAQEKFKDISIYYLIIGGLNDSYEKSLKLKVKQSKCKARVIIRPFSDHNLTRAYYCAADIGLWFNAAITIQESMGTGLYVVLKNKLTVNHLILPNKNGYLYEGSVLVGLMTLLENRLEEILDVSKREKRIEINSSLLSYERIAEDMISGLIKIS